MVPEKKSEYTELQLRFVEALFGEAMGDPNKAKKLAGYDPTTKTSQIVKSVQDIILEQSRLYLAANSPRAILELLTMMVTPNEPGATTKLKVIQEILNRAGVVDKSAQGGDINISNKGRIIILPEKSTPSIIDLQREDFKEINEIYEEIT